MKVIKPIIGILLIVVSAVGLIWWEKYGREEFLMSEVLVASQDIERGEIISAKCFQETKIMKENVIDGSVQPASYMDLQGKVASQFIPKNSQVRKEMFLEQKQLMQGNQSIFVIKEEWIHSRSSSLRKGDKIDVLKSIDGECVGTFVVAYVKDVDEQEVVNAEGNEGNEILQRDFSSGVISRVEIIAEPKEYEVIRNCAEVEGLTFILVQKEV